MENLTAAQLLDAVIERLRSCYEILDVDPATIGFTRPSAYVDLYRIKPQRISPGMYECTAMVQITISVPQDPYGLPSREQLLEEQLRVMDLFRAGYLTVGGRAPRVEVSAGGIVQRQAYVDLSLRYVVPVDPAAKDTGVITDAIAAWDPASRSTRR